MKKQTIEDRIGRYGTGALSDADILAVFLTRKQCTSPQDRAIALIKTYGSVSAMCTALRNDITNIPEINRRQALQLVAGWELATRSVQSQLIDKDVLSSPGEVRKFLSLHLSGLEHEVFGGIFLDNRHRVIAYRELFKGTIDSAAVYPRECVKACLTLNAAAVIWAHNHPSGVAEPSDTDVRLTRKLTDALALIDVRVLDHIVIGQGTQTSLAERGLI